MNDTTTRHRAVTWDDPARVAAAGRVMAGIHLLRAIQAGELPPVPVAVLIGMSFVEIELGRVTMRLTPGEHLYNPIGTVHGGIIATLLDSVMGCAIHSTLPRRRGYTTLEIKVNYVRGVTAASGELTAVGRVVHAGQRTGVAEASVTDARGALCATASTTCLIFDMYGIEQGR